MSKKTITIDDVLGDYPQLGDKKYGLYWARALVRSGVAVGSGPLSEDMQAYIAWMKSVGIGATQVITANTDSEGTLYESVLADEVARRAILEMVQQGALLQVFKSSPIAFEFVSRLGLNWKEHVLNPDPDVAEQWNGKDYLRQRAAEEGFSELNPRHYICQTESDFAFAVETLSKETDYVVKLRPSSASTDGMVFFKKGEKPSQEVRDQFEEGGGVIVEEFIFHYPASLVFEIHDRPLADGFHVEILHSSMQFLKGVPVGDPVRIEHMLDRRKGTGVGDHRGNISAPYGASLGPVPSWRMERIGKKIRDFAEAVIFTSGYRGKFNVDLLMDARPEVMELRSEPSEDQILFLEMKDRWCEINARTSHSMNCQDVADAAMVVHPGALYVCGGNIFPSTAIRGFCDMKDALERGGLLYSKKSLGCIPYHTPLLEGGYEQGGLFVPGCSFEQSINLFLEAEKILSNC